MNKVVLFTLVLFFNLVSCTNQTIPVPEDIILHKIEKISPTHIIEIHIYSVKAENLKVNQLESISNFCLHSCFDCRIVDWINFNSIELNDRIYIESIIFEDISFLDNNLNLINLKSSFGNLT